jgi:hypothetical protein
LLGASGRLYGHGVTYRYWPLFDLRLSTPDLRLRPMTEADLAPVANLLPDDVEQDPGLASYDFADPRVDRGIVSHQAYWRAYGTWRPQSWRLSFVVRGHRR